MNILVLNCGSSSIKYQLLDMKAQPVILAKGLVEKIGLPMGIFTHKPEGKEKLGYRTAYPRPCRRYGFDPKGFNR